MTGIVQDFWLIESLIPRSQTHPWQSSFLWLNVASDAVIMLSYIVITCLLVYLVKKRRDLEFKAVYLVFAAFLLTLAASQALDFWTSWQPPLALHGLFKCFAAGFSVATVYALWRILPIAVTAPSRRHLKKMIHRLNHEVAERQKAESILRESEESFRHLIEGVKDYAIFMVDSAGKVTSWNNAAENILGLSSSEVLGQDFARFYTAQGIAENRPAIELATARAKGHFAMEVFRVRKNGTAFWASVLITPHFDTLGKLKGFVNVTRDISERKEAEENLRRLNEDLELRVEARTRKIEQREKQLITIANALPILVAQIDRQENILFANEVFKDWIIKSDDSFIGKPLRDFIDRSRHGDMEVNLADARLGKAVKFVREVQRGGEKHYLQISYLPEIDENREVRCIVIVASDITQHMRIEEELKQAKEAADAANLAKSYFLANMSHEIRTPLGAVLGFAELIVNSEVTATERSLYVAALRRNGDFLSNIINDILDLSKVEAGKFDIEIRQVPCDEILTDLSTLLNLLATEKGIHLRVSAEGEFPQTICTDPLRLRQVLVNIVGNAIKFTQRGSVCVIIKQLEDLEGKPKLAFIVKDTGAGISPENAHKLFTPFSQADVSTKRKFGGTGLGLILSRRLAMLLGGDVVLTSSVLNQGSVFTITIDPGNSLPQELQQVNPEVDINVMSKPRSKPEDEATLLAGLQLLLIDDALDNQTLVSHFLRMAGATVDTANNGIDAINKASSKDYHVLLMDLQMPIMDGFEATHELRSRGYKKPIIALTAHALKDDRQNCLSRGFTDYLSKPINRKLLLERVAYLAKHSVANQGKGIRI